MKIKRMMLVTFVLLAILTMGAVSASGDTNDTLAADDEMGLSQSSAVEMVSADDGNDDVLSDEFLEFQQSDGLGSAPEDAMGGTQNVVIDNSIDASSTSINATLILTDVRTGKVIMENITFGPVKAIYTSGNNTELENNITDAVNQLLSIAQSYAGDYAVTTNSVNVSTAEAVSRFDNRTYDWSDSEPQGTRLCLVGGSYGTLWQVNLTVTAEFESVLEYCTIAFDSNKGAGEMANETLEVGIVYTLPECAFTKDGRTFFGWNVEDYIIRKPGDNVTINGNATFRAIWLCDDVENRVIFLDNTVDASSTNVVGILMLADNSTGKLYNQTFVSQAIPALYSNSTASADLFADTTDKMYATLIDAALGIAGKSPVTFTGQNLSSAMIVNQWDHRIYRTINIESPDSEGMAIFDENGDINGTVIHHAGGDYGRLWNYNLTLSAEFESSPVINITNAAVILSSQSFTYNGKVQIPTVVSVGGKILKEGSDYTLSLSPATSKNAATYVMTITGTGSYAGVTTAKYTINKAANPLAVKGKTIKVKFSKLKKKAVKLAITKLVKFTKKGQGTMTYAKKSGSKKISINKKTGKVTIKKGLKKGTYKVKAKIKANGNANYKASAYKVVTFKIKVY